MYLKILLSWSNILDFQILKVILSTIIDQII